MPRNRRINSRIRATTDLMKEDRLLLLEEGHCLRDQALAFCELRRVENIDTFGASSLSTLVQMVSNGMGLTLLPEISIDHETRHGGIRLMRFAEPEPMRTLGLAWRATSPRKRDFIEFGKLIAASKTQSQIGLNAIRLESKNNRHSGARFPFPSFPRMRESIVDHHEWIPAARDDD